MKNIIVLKWLTEIVNYFFDAWGKVVVKAENISYNNTSLTYLDIANINPFRYRGYYYDTESSFYYLNSRYYDPEICRFINADKLDCLDPDNLNGLNLYVYCLNNPITNVDFQGNSLMLIFSILIAATLGGAVAKGVQSYNEGKRGWELFGDILLGGAIGLAVGGFIVAVGAATVGAFAGLSATVFGGVNVLQAFAIGALAVDFTAFVVAPLYGIEMEGIELETPKYDANEYSPPQYKNQDKNYFNIKF